MPTHPDWRIVVQNPRKAAANATPKELKLARAVGLQLPDDAPFKVFDLRKPFTAGKWANEGSLLDTRSNLVLLRTIDPGLKSSD